MARKRKGFYWSAEDLRDPRWQKVRQDVLRRDGWACCCCGKKAKSLDVHHWRYIEGRRPWEYCLGDLQSFCRECHDRIHNVKDAYHDASRERKKDMWRTLVGGEGLIEHGDFMILWRRDDEDFCAVLHVPSFKAVYFDLPAWAIHEKMQNEPETLGELRLLIMRGPSAVE